MEPKNRVRRVSDVLKLDSDTARCLPKEVAVVYLRAANIVDTKNLTRYVEFFSASLEFCPCDLIYPPMGLPRFLQRSRSIETFSNSTKEQKRAYNAAILSRFGWKCGNGIHSPLGALACMVSALTNVIIGPEDADILLDHTERWLIDLEEWRSVCGEIVLADRRGICGSKDLILFHQKFDQIPPGELLERYKTLSTRLEKIFCKKV